MPWTTAPYNADIIYFPITSLITNIVSINSRINIGICDMFVGPSVDIMEERGGRGQLGFRSLVVAGVPLCSRCGEWLHWEENMKGKMWPLEENEGDLAGTMRRPISRFTRPLEKLDVRTEYYNIKRSKQISTAAYHSIGQDASRRQNRIDQNSATIPKLTVITRILGKYFAALYCTLVKQCGPCDGVQIYWQEAVSCELDAAVCAYLWLAYYISGVKNRGENK